MLVILSLFSAPQTQYYRYRRSGTYTPIRSVRPMAHLANTEANKLAQDTLANTKTASGAVNTPTQKKDVIQQLKEGIVFNKMCFGCGSK